MTKVLNMSITVTQLWRSSTNSIITSMVEGLRHPSRPGDTLKKLVSRSCKAFHEAEEFSDCYSDHYEDIRTKGSCDYCEGSI